MRYIKSWGTVLQEGGRDAEKVLAYCWNRNALQPVAGSVKYAQAVYMEGSKVGQSTLQIAAWACGGRAACQLSQHR